MNDDFDQNFIWYEWTFVSPDEAFQPDSMPHDETGVTRLERWDEEHRWMT